jgi:ankyrin repeat protein
MVWLAFILLGILTILSPGLFQWLLIVLLFFGLCLIVLMRSLGKAFEAEERIVEAARTGDETLVAAVLADHPRAIRVRDKRGDTLLHLAARAGNRDLIELLVFVGADPGATNPLGQTPADVARSEGVRQLLYTWENKK